MKKLNKLILGLFSFVAFIAFGMIPGSEVHAAETSGEWKRIDFGDTIKAGSTIRMDGDTDCLIGDCSDDYLYVNNWVNNNFQNDFDEFIDDENTVEVSTGNYDYDVNNQDYYIEYERVFEYTYSVDIIDFIFRFGYAQEIRTPCGDNWFYNASVAFDSVDIVLDGEIVCRAYMEMTCPGACNYGFADAPVESAYTTIEDIVVPKNPNPDDLDMYIYHVLTDSFVYQEPTSVIEAGGCAGFGNNLSTVDEKTYSGDITIDSNYVIKNTDEDFTLSLGYMNQALNVSIFFNYLSNPVELYIYRRCESCHTSNVICGDNCSNVSFGDETYCQKVTNVASYDLILNQDYSAYYDLSNNRCCDEDELVIDFKGVPSGTLTYILVGRSSEQITNPFEEYSSGYTMTGSVTDFTKVDSVKVEYPTYAFPGAVGELPFSSIKIGEPIATMLDESASEEDYEHYSDQLGDWFMSFDQLDVNNYRRIFDLKGTYTGVEYKLWFEVNVSDDSNNTITYSVYLEDASKVNHLLGVTSAAGSSMPDPKITHVSNEYIFTERVTIYGDSGWFYDDPESGSSAIECNEYQEQLLGCMAINAVDYGDLIAPSIDTELHITSSTDAPLSINEILNMITVKDETDGDISQNVTLVSTTYDPQNLVLGKHPFNVSVCDAAGNEATATFYVTVYDVTAPVIDGINSYSQSYDDPITLDDILANLTVTDNFDEDVTINLVRDGYTGNEAKVGTYNVIFNATDTAGNSCVDYVVSVEVFDKKAPIVTAPDNIECGNDKLLTLPEIQSKISVIDGCDGKLEYTINGYDAYRATYSTVKQYPITITATDKSGNATNHTIVLEVKDEVEPKFFIARNFVISITAGEVITNDMIISFLTQVGELRKADVDFVQCSYEDAEGEYEVLVFMKDASVYKTSIRVGAQEVEIEEKVGFWTKVGNWFKSIPNFFTKSIPNFFTKTIPGWFKGMGEKISNWWNNLWPWTKDKEPTEEPEVENEPSIEEEPALALEPAITMTVTDEFVVYEYPEFECDPGVPATMPELA